MNSTPKPGDAGTDAKIDQRLAENPESVEAQLDSALDESMDGSDTPGIIQPGNLHDPVPSTGYDAEQEAKLAAKDHH